LQDKLVLQFNCHTPDVFTAFIKSGFERSTYPISTLQYALVYQNGWESTVAKPDAYHSLLELGGAKNLMFLLARVICNEIFILNILGFGPENVRYS